MADRVGTLPANSISMGQEKVSLKAAVGFEAGYARIEEVEIPRLRSGDVPIYVRASGICGSDLHASGQDLIDGLGVSSGSVSTVGHEYSGRSRGLAAR